MREQRQVIYRGSLKSCNYECHYCPFSKNKASKPQLCSDQNALDYFTSHLVAGKLRTESILFAPYGEALIHIYYWTALAKLTSISTIRAVGCQTNLSFSVEESLAHFIEEGGEVTKLRLWCTFHGTMTTVENFAQQVKKLRQNGVLMSVGVVGDPDALQIIQELRYCLPLDCYLWINKMDGCKIGYTKEQILSFTEIDPYFSLELKAKKADFEFCDGGNKNLFINAKGDCFSCNLSTSVLGNLYQKDADLQKYERCLCRNCSCFLAYQNRTDLSELHCFGRYPLFRIPTKVRWFGKLRPNIKAVFFDIDGTLTEADGLITAQTIRYLKDLHTSVKLYFATSLPYQNAKRKCAAVFSYFDGGVFAGGADLRLLSHPYHRIITLEADVTGKIDDLIGQYSLKIRIYKHEKRIYRVTLFQDSITAFLPQFLNNLRNMFGGNCNIIIEEKRIGITDRSASKRNGILELSNQLKLSEEEVYVVGNSKEDRPMLDYFRNSTMVGAVDKARLNW